MANRFAAGAKGCGYVNNFGKNLALWIIIGLLLVASVMSTSVLAWICDAAARRTNRDRAATSDPQLTPAGVGNQER